MRLFAQLVKAWDLYMLYHFLHSDIMNLYHYLSALNLLHFLLSQSSIYHPTELLGLVKPIQRSLRAFTLVCL